MSYSLNNIRINLKLLIFTLKKYLKHMSSLHFVSLYLNMSIFTFLLFNFKFLLEIEYFLKVYCILIINCMVW